MRSVSLFLFFLFLTSGLIVYLLIPKALPNAQVLSSTDFSGKTSFDTAGITSVSPTVTPSPAEHSVSPAKTPKTSPTSVPSVNTVQQTTPAPAAVNNSQPAPTSTPTPQPSANPSSSSSGDVGAYIIGEINAYRQSQGLSSVTTDSYTCAFARKRAEEISKNFNHDGFKDYPYPSYSKVTENIAMDGNYKEVVNRWKNSPGHAENMRADTPFVCVEKFENYYAYEGWKP